MHFNTLFCNAFQNTFLNTFQNIFLKCISIFISTMHFKILFFNIFQKTFPNSNKNLINRTTSKRATPWPTSTSFPAPPTFCRHHRRVHGRRRRRRRRCRRGRPWKRSSTRSTQPWASTLWVWSSRSISWWITWGRSCGTCCWGRASSCSVSWTCCNRSWCVRDCLLVGGAAASTRVCCPKSIVVWQQRNSDSRAAAGRP